MAVQWRNDRERYGVISIALHWLGAAAILAMLGTAGWIFAAPNEEIEGARIQLHASIGATLYLVMGVRILWSWFERKPAPLSGSPKQRAAARVVHGAMLLLIAMQLVTGPLNVWSGGWPIAAFDFYAIPSPFGEQPWHDAIGEAHRYSGLALALLVALHLAAVLKHTLIDRDGTLGRMLGLRPRNAAPWHPDAAGAASF